VWPLIFEIIAKRMKNMGNNIMDLCLAAHKGDNDRLNALLADPLIQAKINEPIGKFGHSALFFACYGNANATTVSILLKAGANPSQRDYSNRLCLHFAANSLDVEIIQVILNEPNMSALRTDTTCAGITPVHALFLPGSIDPDPVRRSKLPLCLPPMLGNQSYGDSALKIKDSFGLTPMKLIRHFGLVNEVDGACATSAQKKLLKLYLNNLKVPENIPALMSTQALYNYNRQELLDAAIDETLGCTLLAFEAFKLKAAEKAPEEEEVKTKTVSPALA